MNTSWVRIRRGNAWQIHLFDEGFNSDYEDVYFNARSARRIWSGSHFLSQEQVKKLFSDYPEVSARVDWLEPQVLAILDGTFNPPDEKELDMTGETEEPIDAHFVEVEDDEEVNDSPEPKGIGLAVIVSVAGFAALLWIIVKLAGGNTTQAICLAGAALVINSVLGGLLRATKALHP